MQLIRMQGTSAFAMRKVARRAGCQPAALYHYVRSKDDILAAVASEVGRRFVTGLLKRTAAAGGPPLRLLEASVQALLDLAEQEPYVWELLFLDRRVAAVGRQICFQLHDQLDALLIKCMDEAGTVRREVVPRAASVLLTLAIGEGSLRVCRPHLIPSKVPGSVLVAFAVRRLSDGTQR